MKRIATTALVITFLTHGHAQVFKPSNNPGPANNSGGGDTTIVNKQQSKQNNPFLGNEVPLFDPGAETLTWDGQSWNVTNQRAFAARFEKYLNAPAANSEDDRAYRSTLEAIRKAISPNNPGGPNLQRGVGLLYKASTFYDDANLCDAIGQAVYGVWLAKRNVGALRKANSALESERRLLNHNMKIEMDDNKLAAATRDKKSGNKKGSRNSVQQGSTLATYILSASEIEAMRKQNQVEMVAGILRKKVEFQALIVQLFMQRRYEHVRIATRTYTLLFKDGDGEVKMNKGSDMSKIFKTSVGFSPTISGLDAMAGELIRDVDDSMLSFHNAIEKDEIDSASKRLTEAFVVGEYLPRVRTLELKDKEKILGYVRDTNQLVSATQVKDFALASKLIVKMKTEAKDFDYSKAQGYVDTQKTISNMRVKQAKLDLQQNNAEGVQENLSAATEIWPNNPAIQTLMDGMVDLGDVKSQVVLEFDTLMNQGNYRMVYNEKGKFLAALYQDEKRRANLEQILENIAEIDTTIKQAKSLQSSGASEGAWELLEELFEKFPDDKVLSSERSNLTTSVAKFVDTLNRARELEDRRQTGSSLAWYLKARKLYPRSIFAKQGIDRIVGTLLPNERNPGGQQE